MNGKTHKIIGMGSGAAVALARANGQETWKQIAEALGGAIGGYIGARLPDALEPATHSWHRDVCHSVAAGGGVVLGARKVAKSWEAKCRSLADEFAARRADPAIDDLRRFLYFLAEIALRIAAGLMSGVATGFVSHLLLDATTPRSIPLLTKALV